MEDVAEVAVVAVVHEEVEVEEEVIIVEIQ